MVERAYPKTPNGAWRQAELGVVAISVGQPYHEGENIAAIANFARENFSHPIVLVADTLQRWNKSDAPQVAHAAARRHGDEWLKRNAAAIAGMQVMRWDDYTEALDFPATLTALRELALTDGDFGAALQADIDGYTRRLEKRGEPVSARKIACGRSYVLEELAADCMAAKAQPRSVIYPNAEMRSYRKLRQLPHAIAAPMRDLHWCYVKIGNAAEPAPENGRLVN